MSRFRFEGEPLVKVIRANRATLKEAPRLRECAGDPYHCDNCGEERPLTHAVLVYVGNLDDWWCCSLVCARAAATRATCGENAPTAVSDQSLAALRLAAMEREG